MAFVLLPFVTRRLFETGGAEKVSGSRLEFAAEDVEDPTDVCAPLLGS